MSKFLKSLWAVLFIIITASSVVHANMIKSEYLSAFPEDYLIGACNKQGKCGYINIKQEVKIPFEYKITGNDINTEGVAKVTKPANNNYKDLYADQLYGIIDKTGKVLVECRYYYIDNFYDGMAEVKDGHKKQGGKNGYFDKNGNLVIPIIYRDTNRFVNGRAVVSCDGKKYGVIDKTGKTIIPFEYDKIWNFHNEYTAVKKGDKWGIIDRNGKLIAPIQYSRIEKIYNNYVVLTLDSKAGILDCKTGKYVLAPEYFGGYISNPYNRMNNKYELCKTDKNGVQYCGMFNYDGKELVPLKYKRVFYKGDDLYELLAYDGTLKYKHPQNKLTFLDTNKDLKIYEYKNGYLIASSSVKGRGVGLVDDKGKWVVPPQYSEIICIKDGMIKAETDHRPCFYNIDGELIVPPGYMFADDFEDGFSVVSKEGKTFLGAGLIDKYGKVRIPTKYQDIKRIGHGLYRVTTHAFWRYGVLDADGKTIIPIGKYSYISF